MKLEQARAQFKEPTAVAVNDENGDVYVLDSGNNRIEYFSAEGKEYKDSSMARPAHAFVGFMARA